MFTWSLTPTGFLSFDISAKPRISLALFASTSLVFMLWLVPAPAWNATLQDYVLISQTQPLVEHFRRQPDGTWVMTEAAGLDAAVVLSSISCIVKLADVYDRIEFAGFVVQCLVE